MGTLESKATWRARGERTATVAGETVIDEEGLDVFLEVGGRSRGQQGREEKSGGGGGAESHAVEFELTIGDRGDAEGIFRGKERELISAKVAQECDSPRVVTRPA